MAKKHGLKTYFFHDVEAWQDVEGVIHDSLVTWQDKLSFRRKDRTWDAAKYGKSIIHASVLERAEKRCPVQTGKPKKEGDDIYFLREWDVRNQR